MEIFQCQSYIGHAFGIGGISCNVIDDPPVETLLFEGPMQNHTSPGLSF